MKQPRLKKAKADVCEKCGRIVLPSEYANPEGPCNHGIARMLRPARAILAATAPEQSGATP